MLTKKPKNKKPIFYIKLAVAAVLVCAVLTGFIANTFWQKSSFSAGFPMIATAPHMDVRCRTSRYHLNDVTLDFYLGFHEKDEYFNEESKQYDIIALYLCKDEDLYYYDHMTEFSDYKNVDRYYFLQEIPLKDAYTSPEYQYHIGPFGGIDYKSHQKLTISRSVLETYEGIFLIRVVFLSSTDHNTYLWGGAPISPRVGYKIINDDVILDVKVSQRES